MLLCPDLSSDIIQITYETLEVPIFLKELIIQIYAYSLFSVPMYKTKHNHSKHGHLDTAVEGERISQTSRRVLLYSWGMRLQDDVHDDVIFHVKIAVLYQSDTC